MKSNLDPQFIKHKSPHLKQTMGVLIYLGSNDAVWTLIGLSKHTSHTVLQLRK